LQVLHIAHPLLAVCGVRMDQKNGTQLRNLEVTAENSESELRASQALDTGLIPAARSIGLDDSGLPCGGHFVV
jgi:hypothetical protein